MALDRAEGAIGVGDGLTLGHLTDEHFAVTSEGHDRRCGAAAFGVRNDDGLASFQNRDD
jgi:hypothetical protein